MDQHSCFLALRSSVTSAAGTCITVCSSCLPEHLSTAQAAAQVRKWQEEFTAFCKLMSWKWTCMVNSTTCWPAGSGRILLQILQWVRQNITSPESSFSPASLTSSFDIYFLSSLSLHSALHFSIAIFETWPINTLMNKPPKTDKKPPPKKVID